jgi:hypothetical protein
VPLGVPSGAATRLRGRHSDAIITERSVRNSRVAEDASIHRRVRMTMSDVFVVNGARL